MTHFGVLLLPVEGQNGPLLPQKSKFFKISEKQGLRFFYIFGMILEPIEGFKVGYMLYFQNYIHDKRTNIIAMHGTF